MEQTSQKIFDSLGYCPETGKFTWKNNRKHDLVEKEAGYIDKSTGYVRIHVDGKKVGAHRLAYLFIHGKFPEMEVDHIDGNRSNNKANNLRLASRQQNQHNRMGKGTCFHKASNKWTAYITVNYKRVHLGLFETEQEAHDTYLKAKEKYHPFSERAKHGTT